MTCIRTTAPIAAITSPARAPASNTSTMILDSRARTMAHRRCGTSSCLTQGMKNETQVRRAPGGKQQCLSNSCPWWRTRAALQILAAGAVANRSYNKRQKQPFFRPSKPQKTLVNQCFKERDFILYEPHISCHTNSPIRLIFYTLKGVADG